MKMKKIALLAASVALVLVVMNSCGSSSTNNNNTSNDGNSTIEQPIGPTESFYGSLISDLLRGLMNGATGKLGGDTMGLILQYLGWGNSGDSKEVTLLKDMKQTLEDIKNELVNVESKLSDIINLMEIDMDKILLSIIDPTDAINNIGTSEQTLQLMSDDTKPGEGNRTAIKKFANDNEETVRGNVNAIHKAFMGDPPLLNTLVDKANTQVHSGYGTITDAYNSLELWTSQLITSQLRGVNIVVESRRILDGNASALDYLENYYQPQLEDEISNPEKGVSFIYNAWSLALLNASPYGGIGNFFSQDIHDFLQRAEFYKMRVLKEKNLGLHVLIFTTQDIEDPGYLYAVNSNGHESRLDCTKYDISISGATYDYWMKDDITVKGSNSYNVYDCKHDLSAGVDTYKIYRGRPADNGTVIAESTVQKYDENYTVKADGNITFGLATTIVRTPVNHYTKDSANWLTQKRSGGNCDTDIYGDPNSRPIQANIECDHYHKGYARIELDGHFDYDSDAKERTMYVYWHAKFHTHASAPKHSGGNAYSYYRVGVWDSTVSEFASSSCNDKTYHRLHASDDHDYSSDHDIHDHCSFTAKPGHHYYVYFDVKVNADTTDSSYEVYATSELDTVYYVHLQFPEGER